MITIKDLINTSANTINQEYYVKSKNLFLVILIWLKINLFRKQVMSDLIHGFLLMNVRAS